MAFTVQCEICGKYAFKPEDVVVYRRAPEGLREIKLEGQEPCSGVRCIHRSCVEWLARLVNLTGVNPRND